jgi:hypothetical protein
MDLMIKAFTSFYLISKKNTMNSSVLDMQVKDSSPMGIDWAPVYHKTYPHMSPSNALSRPPRGGEGPMLSPERRDRSG